MKALPPTNPVEGVEYTPPHNFGFRISDLATRGKAIQVLGVVARGWALRLGVREMLKHGFRICRQDTEKLRGGNNRFRARYRWGYRLFENSIPIAIAIPTERPIAVTETKTRGDRMRNQKSPPIY